MGVTCNRVFDCAPDSFKALADIISCGCERILTSGQKSAAPDAGWLSGTLVQQAGNHIIMPGAGIKSSNIAKLKKESGAIEFHSSARKIAFNPVTFINKEVSDYGNVCIADEREVRAMITALNER